MERLDSLAILVHHMRLARELADNGEKRSKSGAVPSNIVFQCKVDDVPVMSQIGWFRSESFHDVPFLYIVFRTIHQHYTRWLGAE